MLVTALAALVTGCAGQGPALLAGVAQKTSHAEPQSCEVIRSAIDAAVARSQVRDAQARRVAGMPYLRVNRFLAHLGRRFRKRQSGKAFGVWVARLRQLDDQAFRIETANLPKSESRRLRSDLFGSDAQRGRVTTAYGACAEMFVANLLRDSRRRRQLVRAAKVPDDYSDLAQLAGLYPLTSIPVSVGWENWKKKHLATFQQPVGALPVQGKIVEWAPALGKNTLTSRKVRSIVDLSKDRALGIPEPKRSDRRRLFETFAPIWQLDVAGDYDHTGHPSWVNNGQSIGIDRRRSVVFTRISHAVVNGQILLQLNYAIWFQARPRDGPLDLLGGHLDGVIWRVTLAPDGRPLIYDSIHACGCYHLLFPLERSMSPHSRRPNPRLEELPAILSGAQVPRPGQRVLLRIASATHYLLGVTVVEAKSNVQARRQYRLINDDVLRSLPLSGNRRRSLFGADGLVAGTERLERFLLWPTGVSSPGALRQWGRHAIAFADRRHFDDPILFERIFK